MDFELIGPEASNGLMIPIFSWGLMIEYKPNLNWPMDDLEDKFLDPEPKIIDLDSEDEVIKGFKNMIIVSDDSD